MTTGLTQPPTLVRRGLLAVAVVALASTGLAPAAAQAAPPDDAGSGRDAGEDFATAVPIESGVVHTASLDVDPATGAVADDDWFTFHADAGQVINAEATDDSPAVGCLKVVAPDGSVLASGTCARSHFGVIAPVDGTYALSYGDVVADQGSYLFGLGLDAPSPMAPDLGRPSDPDVEQRPGQVVVAVADSGVNPYHEIYSRPENTVHPCTWVEGFDDCSVPALELSIGEYDTFGEAYEADRDVWESLELHQWYWIPRTNIIGAVCEGSATVGHTSSVCILDEHGHGTGTTSAVLSEAPDALLLVHEGNSGAYDLEFAPVVADIQSHSYGAPAPVPIHLTDPVWEAFGVSGFANPGAFDPETIFFIAAGNEAPFPTFLDYDRVHPSVQVVGGAYPGHASRSSWSVYDFASWYCRPTARHDSVTAYRSSYCGTSFSAPTAAGTAAAALLEIRRREATTVRSTPEMVSETVSRDGFVEALRAGATYEPDPDRFPNRPGAAAPALVEGHEHLFWGYGWLDRTRVDAIVACALDGECPEKSADAQEYNERRQELRRVSAGEPGERVD